MNLHAILPEPVSILSATNFTDLVIPHKATEEEAARFIAALTHEIRNPLSSINLATEMLKSQLTESDQQNFLDIILRGSDRINEIVTELLLSSWKTVAGEKHSVNDLLDEILFAAEDRILLNKIQVTKAYSAPDERIELNRPKIKIALTNIIVNAIEAMKEMNGVLHLITTETNGRHTIEIADNGVGISNVNLKNIFRPYFTSKKGGLGIGLSATYDILFAEKVEIKAASKIGQGTSFVLVFPETTSQ